MARGYFITLEGGEGAGKSTQARRIAASLAAAGIPVLRTREPGGAPGAERIRELLLSPGSWDSLTEAMLHFAARREHVVRSIRPMLEAGAWVICDRFADSTLAYQGAGQGLAFETPGRPKFFGFGEPVGFGQAAYGGGCEHRGILTTDAADPSRG